MSDVSTTWPHPYTITDHAYERWKERWRSAWSWAVAKQDLQDRIKQAIFVEEDPGNATSFWRLPEEGGRHPLIVVDGFGEVKTVLPREATKPNRRPRK